ncbi:vWA domain-containing protein [Methylosarcina fibrata]|uniref:hypothetical protein n=1 Tax=Methylosarcina fibrata TaxID=105972 RepID=UPI0003774547|nr:hypothetical protein [Methylosarcina fibrata]
MSVKTRIQKLEAQHGGGAMINAALELQRLQEAARQEEADYRQLLADGVPAEEVRRIREAVEQTRAAEQKTECERIIAENNNPAWVTLAKAALSAMEYRT